MSRVEENEELIEKIRNQRKPNGRYEQIIADHAGEIAMYLCDISKSLAVIADSYNSKKATIARYSVGDIVEFKYGDTRRGRIKNSYVRVSSNSNMSGIYYDIALLSNYYLLTDIEEKDIITVYKKEEEE